METHNPRACLEAEFLRRREKNKSYSLRAFAKLLDLPSGRISQLLSEKRRFTVRLGEKIAGRLNYDPQARADLLRAIALSRGTYRPGADAPPAKRAAATFRALDMNQFRLIAEPLHFSLLSLLEIEGFDGRAATAAARLGVSVVEARGALRRLRDAGLVVAEENRFRLSGAAGLTTSHDISSPALRQAHARVLEETLSALETVPVEERDVTSISLAIDPKRMAEAKLRIREFRRTLAAFLEGGVKREVYRLNIQLMPLTKGRMES